MSIYHKQFLLRLNRIKYRKIIWTLAISETIHNIEEAILLPHWSRSAGIWHPPVNSFEFVFAVIIATLIIYGIIFYFSNHENKPARYLMGGTLVMILFNVFVPHSIVSIITAQYAPGVVSGILLNVPVTIYLLWRGIIEGEFTIKTLAIGTVIFILIMAPLMFASFKIGSYF